MNIKIYGSRGTMPFFGRDNLKYGGNTSCVKVTMGGQTIIIDCGSGLAQASKELGQSPLCLDVLVSHLHLDHIIGLGSFPQAWNDEHYITFYTKSRDGRPLAEQLFGAFKPPYWPVDLARINLAGVREIKEDEPFMLGGDVRVVPFASNHRDGTLAFRIEYIKEGKTLVHLLDHEMDYAPDKHEAMLRYCKGADLIVFDSAYTPEDYASKRGWGHSAYTDGIALAERANAKKLVFCHFDQKYSDAKLDGIADGIDGIGSRFFIAYDGMELRL